MCYMYLTYVDMYIHYMCLNLKIQIKKIMFI